MSKIRTIITDGGRTIEPGSLAAHEIVARLVREAYDSLDEIEYSLLHDDETFSVERHVLETIKSSLGSLRGFHTAMAENLKRYQGDVETSRREAVGALDRADRRLRQKTR